MRLRYERSLARYGVRSQFSAKELRNPFETLAKHELLQNILWYVVFR